MPQARRRLPWYCAALAAAVLALNSPASDAAESPASAKNTDQLVAGGNLRAAEIELRNAIQESPQDPLLRSQLAQLYLQLGDPISAEREARAARDRNGKEADYLPVLLNALRDRANTPTSSIWSNQAIVLPCSKAKFDWRSASRRRGFMIAPRPKR